MKLHEQNLRNKKYQDYIALSIYNFDTEYRIDRRIIPLFSSHLERKKKILEKSEKLIDNIPVKNQLISKRLSSKLILLKLDNDLIRQSKITKRSI
jgi:hypothetical protein